MQIKAPRRGGEALWLVALVVALLTAAIVALAFLWPDGA